MFYRRMPIESESPEELGYDSVKFNLAESSVSDRPLSSITADIGSLKLAYGDHRGLPELRSRIAADAPGLTAADVLLTPGAAAALFFLHSALLDKQDHLVVVHPNYATNIETPYAIGCAISQVELNIENGFRIDVEQVRQLLGPQTRLISITSPHNPSGVPVPHETMQALAELARSQGCKLLVDETYRELIPGKVPPSAAAIGPEVVAVSSVSKAYGVPGLRIGWLLCSDPALMEKLLAVKEQVLICNSVLDEALVLEIMRRKTDWLSETLRGLGEKRTLVTQWLKKMDQQLAAVPPEAGAVCFPRIRDEISLDTGAFYDELFGKYATLVGRGRWFDCDERNFRIGYGWPSYRELEQGLVHIENALKSARR